MKKVFLAAAMAACTLPMAAKADTILGIYASAGVWNQDFSGQFQSSNDGGLPPTVIDMEDDFGFGEERGNTFSLALEHPVPVIPNIRIARTELSQTATDTLNRDIVYNGETYSLNEEVTSTVALDFDDYLLYYEILDNWVSLDIGINIRMFDGEIALSSATDSSKEQIEDAPIPMLYARADFQLPFSGLSIGGEAMAISVGDASLRDFRVRIAYETSIGLGIEVGQRSFTIDYDTGDADDEVVDLEFSGTYANATYHF